MVCDKVKIILDKRSATSDSIMLPWAPAIYQEVQLKAVGGLKFPTCSISLTLIGFFCS